MAAETTLIAAFAAGLISFLSPCVLPLVPPYLCYLAGASLEDLSGNTRASGEVARRAILAAFLFVLGFATVFVALGATASSIGQLLRQHLDWLAIIAGVLVAVMGLHFLGLFRIALLYREARLEGPRHAVGFTGAYLMGLAFGFAWTPCIGPVLAAILAVAASSARVGQGALLLAVYSAGIGVPFIAAAMFVRPFLRFLSRFRKRLGMVEKAMGGLLVAAGVLMLTGGLQSMSYWLLETFPALGRLG